MLITKHFLISATYSHNFSRCYLSYLAVKYVVRDIPEKLTDSPDQENSLIVYIKNKKQTILSLLCEKNIIRKGEYLST